jgi:hypothetical protein
MTATATVQEGNGVPTGTWTDITTARFCTTDAYLPAGTYPIPIPTGSDNNSYVKSFRLKFTGIGTQVTNVNIYTDGTNSFGTGISVYIGDQTGQTYKQATGTAGTTGTAMLTLYSGTITSQTDIFTYNSTAQKTVDATVLGSGTQYSKHFMCQMVVANTATAGTLSPETWTWQYDEI